MCEFYCSRRPVENSTIIILFPGSYFPSSLFIHGHFRFGRYEQDSENCRVNHSTHVYPYVMVVIYNETTNSYLLPPYNNE